MRFALKMPKKADQSIHNVYNGNQEVPKTKKGGEDKKILPPLNRIQPINEIYCGHQSFTYKQFGPS